jgi:hypothetical protein
MQMRTIELMPGGRHINHGDNANALRVCILGDEVKDQLFNKQNPVGRTIMIGSFSYLIVGELIHKDQNSNYSGPDKKKIFIPFHSMGTARPTPRRKQTHEERPAAAGGGRRSGRTASRRILADAKGFDYRIGMP